MERLTTKGFKPKQLAFRVPDSTNFKKSEHHSDWNRVRIFRSDRVIQTPAVFRGGLFIYLLKRADKVFRVLVPGLPGDLPDGQIRGFEQ